MWNSAELELLVSCSAVAPCIRICPDQAEQLSTRHQAVLPPPPVIISLAVHNCISKAAIIFTKIGHQILPFGYQQTYDCLIFLNLSNVLFSSESAEHLWSPDIGTDCKDTSDFHV